MDSLINISICTIICIIIGLFFVYFITFLNYRPSNIKYALACAGTEYKDSSQDDNQSEIKTKSIYTNTFFGKNGEQIDVSKYSYFIVKGNSMKLVNIKDGNLLMVRKNGNTNHFSTNSLPNIFVLKRDRKTDERIKYKIRCGWAIVDLSKNPTFDYNLFEDTLKKIFENPMFNRIRNSDAFTNEEFMKKDFVETRLVEFKERYLKDEKLQLNIPVVLISTTLHTKENKVMFSIHPVENIVGEIEFCYDINKPDVA